MRGSEKENCEYNWSLPAESSTAHCKTELFHSLLKQTSKNKMALITTETTIKTFLNVLGVAEENVYLTVSYK